MKTQVKNWLRWGAAGVFGLMLTLNVMVGLDFDKNKLIPTLTLVELGNQANAQSESEGCQTGGHADKCCSYWDITYPSQGPSSCTTGGNFKCNTCND